MVRELYLYKTMIKKKKRDDERKMDKVKIFV